MSFLEPKCFRSTSITYMPFFYLKSCWETRKCWIWEEEKNMKEGLLTFVLVWRIYWNRQRQKDRFLCKNMHQRMSRNWENSSSMRGHPQIMLNSNKVFHCVNASVGIFPGLFGPGTFRVSRSRPVWDLPGTSRDGKVLLPSLVNAPAKI